MISASAISSKSRQMISNSGRVIYTRAKRLRGAFVVLPFFAAVIISYIYLVWKHPPLWLQDFVVFSAPFLVGVIYYCRTWIYRFRAGASLLAMALGGALFFPVVVCIHAGRYDMSDNGKGLASALLVWALSLYVIWRIFRPSLDMFWNTVLEPLQRDHRRWVVMAVVPLIWAVYAYGAFELIDTQFDWATGRIVHVTEAGGKPACRMLHPGFLGAPWRQVAACPPASTGQARAAS